MRKNIFKIAFISLVCIFFLILILSSCEVIFLGNALSNQITDAFIVIGAIISIPIFIWVNRMPPDDFSAKFLKIIILGLMLLALYFILIDVRTHQDFG